jgi:nuclear pore complex protein Nup214
VGSESGTLTQYKPDLKAVKTFSPPYLGSGNVAVVNVLWLSNYQFAAIYKDKVNTDERPGIAMFVFLVNYALFQIWELSFFF